MRRAHHESAAERQLTDERQLTAERYSRKMGFSFPLAGSEPIRIFLYPKLRISFCLLALLCTNTPTYLFQELPLRGKLSLSGTLPDVIFFSCCVLERGTGGAEGQYCGGEEAAQPVPPHRARKERGQVQCQTSAETHEAEPFQMRDMYMSLIGAQLQSIHRGQVATAEMIVGMYDTPPAHRWTMEEFHNVVAWLEEPVQGGGAEAAEASVREMEEDEADDDDAFEDDEDKEEEEDTKDISD
ncbi:hypothetical protein LR48_Vigan03g099300 [Vigna angularis]|uniref:Uncharacterized protein n=1 Tax=Phaseolus angularis TaxID=3914 RepID=A0A0L9U4A9_PHAAN|nr:hypothetical protein LR48_Vigan03g099300 [Vigna angularis]